MIDICDGEIFGQKRNNVRAKIDNDGEFSRIPVEKGDEQRTKKFTQQIDAAHLRVQGW